MVQQAPFPIRSPTTASRRGSQLCTLCRATRRIRARHLTAGVSPRAACYDPRGVDTVPHVVLLGDSIFDNAPYTNGGPDVISQVHGLLPPSWNATLLAVDGSMTGDVAGQLNRLPPDATDLVLSVGGNDALDKLGIWSFRCRTCRWPSVCCRTSGWSSSGVTPSSLERAWVPGCPCALHHLQRVFRGRVLPAYRVNDAHGVQRRHHPRGGSARAARHRPTGRVCQSGRLRQSHRAVVGRRREIRASDRWARLRGPPSRAIDADHHRVTR